MTTFEDGPAKGQTLMLQRAPVFLRVVVDPREKVDALDQLNDTPASNEQIFAYVLTAEPDRFHIYKRGGGSGWYAIANYRQVLPQQRKTAVPIAKRLRGAVQASAKLGERPIKRQC